MTALAPEWTKEMQTFLAGAELSKSQRIHVLRVSGYMLTFDRSRLMGTNDGKQVYEIWFTNEDTGEPDQGCVYVWVKDGVLKGDF